jgi:hypothetical protein
MNNENKTNVNATGTTSPGGPGRPPQPQPSPPQKLEDRVDKKVTEADYTTRQADEARAAITAVVADMKHALAQGANLKEWTRQYPWIVAGAATVGGFLTGMLVTPSKEETFREKWEALKDKFTPDVGVGETGASPEATARTIADQPEAQNPSFLAVLLREALKTIGPTIGGLITGALAGQPAEPGASGNGHSTHSEAYATEPPGGAPQA